MTTPTKPQLSAPASPASKRPPLRVIAFAVIACGLLVVAALAVTVLRPDGGDASVNAIEVDPQTYTADAVQRVASMSASGLDPLSLASGGLPTNVEAGAHASIDAALASAMQVLEQSLADAALPPLPADYIAGDVVDVRLPPVQGYSLPTLPTLPVSGGFVGTTVDAVASPVASRQGTSPLGDLVGQVENGLATLEGLLGDLPTGELPVGELPVGGGPLSGLPLGGDAPSQAQGAEDAIEPDEEGAALASAHAKALLGATSGAYGATSADLSRLLVAYQDLAVRVEETLALTQQIEDEANSEIQATLDERLADIDAEARRLNAQASRLVADHLRLADKAQAQADADVRAILDQHITALDQVRDDAIGNVTGRIQAVQAEASARTDEVNGLVNAATAELGKPGATPEALYGLQAVQAAGVAAVLKIERDAKAEVATLQQSSARINAQTAAIEQTLVAKANEARLQINGTVASATEGSADVKEYLIAFAQAQAQAAEDLEIAAASEAVEDLEAAVDAHVAKLLRTSLKSTEAAAGILESTTTLVQDVEEMASSEVGKDLDYIVKVSQDYGRVPTEDRKARSSHWSGEVVALDGRLSDTLAAGLAVERLAQRTVAAAAQASADIEALA